MAARKALEWIGTSKARLVFRYEISDLLSQQTACSLAPQNGFDITVSTPNYCQASQLKKLALDNVLYRLPNIHAEIDVIGHFIRY